MDQWIIDYQLACRIGLFFLFLTIFSWWESKAPWRPGLNARPLRFARHLGLALISGLCVRLMFPLLTIGAAVIVEQKQIGILNHSHLPYITKIALGIVALDFVIYLQHRVLHRYQLLWRIHKVHHIDKQVDVSTGVRFHPLEALFTMTAKILGVLFFGVPVLGVFLFEVLLNLASLYTHLNINLERSTDKILRRVMVTPHMHRIHHSDYLEETNSNYGFCFSWWDKLFGTYTLYPMAGERKYMVGLEDYRAGQYQTLKNMLLLPFNFKYLKIRPKKIMKTKKTI